MIKISVINKNVMLHVLDNDEAVYLSQVAIVNLVNNIGNSVKVRECIEEDNDLKFKPRAEIIGKFTKDGKFKIAIGVGFKGIDTKKDVDREHTFAGCGVLKTYAELFENDMNSTEEYKALLSIHQINNRSSNSKAAIEI